MANFPIKTANYAASFGSFSLIPARQLLLEAGRPVSVGSRAIELLHVLIERQGEVVSKEELIARVWPNTFVDHGSLRVHIAALRRALGEGRNGNRYIANVSGRGYRFVAPVSFAEMPSPSSAPNVADEPTHNLPPRIVHIVGRTETVDAICVQLQKQRFITIVGPGGVGKTTLALVVAERLSVSYDGVCFVDLGPVSDPLLVPSAFASALGLEVRSENPTPALIAFLGGKKILLVVDSCEHVVDAAAATAERILSSTAGVNILATSREPLRAEGERVHRLLPLSIPSDSAGLTAADALAFSAIQLFVERATACTDTFELANADVPAAVDICRRLDGIPLAIELAAARIDTFGIKGLAELLDDRFRLLKSGRRTALARHQTLSATFDWSYEFLLESERVIFRRLAVFSGGFTVSGAAAVATSSDMALREALESIGNLVAKSLVTADVTGSIVLYRLLDSTRAYALEKLKESGESEALSRRHAEYFRDLLEQAATEFTQRSTADWICRQIDNVRTALNWAFSPSGDSAIAVRLTIAAVPMWMQLSLLNECRQRVERALAAVDPEAGCDERREMKLRAALGWSLMYTTGPERPTSWAWQTAFELAEKVGDVDYQQRALWGLWASRINNGEFGQALAFAERFSACASHGSPERHIADRLIGTALHFLGDQPGARLHLERMLSQYVPPNHRSHIVRFQFDQRVSARMTLARVLWLQGFADQALREASSNIDEALAVDHTLSLCNALGNSACPVALFAGNLGAAERYTGMLSSLTERHGFDAWRAYADVFRGELLARRGELDSGLALLHTGVGKLRDAKFVQYQTAFLLMLAQSLVRAGRLEEGRAALDEALQQCERTDERWCMSELLRVRGEIALLEPTPDRAAAERDFEAALVLARRQQALSWELRSAISLARLRRKEGRIAEARSLLAPVSGRFTEGFGTADLRAANGLLTELA